MLLRSLLFILIGITTASAELVATFTIPDGKTAEHIVPLPALAHEANTTATPSLEPGPYTVTWRGQIEIPKRLRLHFSFQGKGNAQLKINNELVHEEKGTFGSEKSKQLRLNAGSHPVEITYQPKTGEDAQFRLFWEERSFAPEPIPPSAWKLPENITLPTLDQGRIAFADHKCLKCHLPDEPLPSSAMPELHASGPDLTNTGARVTEEWLVRWIAQPDKIKPTTTMPAMVDHRTAEGAQQAADLAAYLATLRPKKEKKETPQPKTNNSLVEKGGALFHQFGCVACHTLPEVDIPDLEHHRIPLNNVASKFQPGALNAFLKNPRAHNPWSQMPDFQLSDEEATSLAGFLTSESTGCHTPDPSEFPPGDPEAGKKLTTSLNCTACHTGLPTPTTPPSPKFADLLKNKDWSKKGCLAEEDQRDNAPRLILKEEEKNHIETFARNHLHSLYRDTHAHYTLRQIETLNCRACHSRNETPSLLSTLHLESKKFASHLKEQEHKTDNTIPSLTHLGEMLNTSYLETLFLGKTDQPARPWLPQRMPSFPQHAHSLAHGLTQLHGLQPSLPDDSPRQPEAAKIGKKLVSIEGLACITCHGAAELPPLASFEVIGINFAQTNKRLQPEYFYRWLRNPHRIDPNSRMPRYTADDGSALRQDILDGDAQKQFEAIWEYLKAGPALENPK